MPNKNWGKKSREMVKAKSLADGKVLAQGEHPYCKKCPLVEMCDNVQYNARDSSIWCADNPREKRVLLTSRVRGELKVGIYDVSEEYKKLLKPTVEARKALKELGIEIGRCGFTYKEMMKGFYEIIQA